MITEESIIDRLASAVAARISPAISLDVDLWDSEHIGAYLKRDARQVTERYAPLPDFPKAYRLPTPGGGRGQPLWRACEIIEWAEKYREKSRKAA